jgi:hypothetical protein
MRVRVSDLLIIEKNMTTNDVIERLEGAPEVVLNQLEVIVNKLAIIKEMQQALNAAISAFNALKSALDAAKLALGIGDVSSTPVITIAKSINLATDSLIVLMQNTYIEV